MKRSTSAAGFTSLVMALVCFGAAAALFHADNANGDALYIAASPVQTASR
ncbi:MAG: hypothetical protein ACFE0P_04325 [Oceanicaulis sp.]